jgi:hypothetical protein
MHVNAFHTEIFTMQRHKYIILFWGPTEVVFTRLRVYSDLHLKERGRNAMFQALSI